jgi:hypothetical protein
MLGYCDRINRETSPPSRLRHTSKKEDIVLGYCARLILMDA